MDAEVRHSTVFDTGAEHLGRIYAEALLGAASRAGVVDTVVDQLNSLVRDVISEHPALASALASPRIDTEDKKRILGRLLADQVDPTLLKFLKVVSDRGRLGYLREIAEAVRRLRNEALNRVVAEVRSAVPLTDPMRDSVRQRLSQTLNQDVELVEKVDPQLIGGLVIRVGDTVFDSSVSGRMASMTKKVRRAFAQKLLEDSNRFASGSNA